MKTIKLFIALSCMLGVFTSNMLGVFTGGGGGFTGAPSGRTNIPAANNNSNANNTPTPARTIIPVSILTSDPLASTPNFQNYGPSSAITNLATSATKFFTTYSASPTRIDSWVVGATGSTAFTQNASGAVSKLVAGDNLVAALNSTDRTLADVWTFDGSIYPSFSNNGNTITDVAVNNYDVYFATGKRFEQYTAGEGLNFVNSCPVFAGSVNAAVTSSCSNYIFTVNDTNNHIECWDNASGVKISSVCASSPVTRLATQDDYVFAVSINSANQIQVFDFTCPFEPSLISTITAAGPVRELAVASSGNPRVFATNDFNTKQLEGWKHNGCTISGFDPFFFCSDIIHIAADSDCVTVYGNSKTEDKMKSYSVSCGDEESCFSIPKSVITHLGSTDCNDVYAVFQNAPNKIQKFNRCGGHAVAFKESASGDITKMVAADNLIVTVSNDNVLDIFSADGCKISSVSLNNFTEGFIFSSVVVNDLVINGDNDGSIYVTMQAVVITNNSIENLNNYIIKFRPCGETAWCYQGRAYEVIKSLATSVDSDYVFATTEEDSIIVFDNNHGKRVGKFYGNAPISHLVAFDDAKVCFVYESCPSVIHVLDFSVPCCPKTFGKICFGDRVLHMLGTSSCHDKLLVVPACSSNEIHGYDISHVNCEGEFDTLDGFDPLVVCDGPIEFLVSSAPSNFTLYRDGYLTNYRFEDEGDVNVQFNLHEQFTHLASTHNNAVFASFVSDKNIVYRWCSEGGLPTAFADAAQGPIAQLVATGNYVVTLNNCADTVDIWKQDGCYKTSISGCNINDIAVNNRNTEDEDCEGSVYLAHENHVMLYSTDGDNETMFPQVSGPVTLIASNDHQALVFTANSDNNKIEAFTTAGVPVSHICAAGPITHLVSKEKIVFAVNSSYPDQIQIFDFACSYNPILLDTVTAAGTIVQIAASENGLELYATNSTNPKDIQGWSISEGCCGCNSTAPLAAYNPFTLTSNISLLAADSSVVAIFGQLIYPN